MMVRSTWRRSGSGANAAPFSRQAIHLSAKSIVDRARIFSLLRFVCLAGPGSLWGRLAHCLLCMRHMRPLLAAAVALLLFSVGPRAARACGSGRGSGGGGDNYTGLIVGVVAGAGALAIGDIAFSIHDLAVDKSSVRSGVVETLLAAPQVAVGVAWISINRSNGQSQVGAALYTAWMTALLVHGIDAIANGSAAPSRGFIEEGAEANLQPAALGLGMTYVDVGSRSAPGLGLIGRF